MAVCQRYSCETWFSFHWVTYWLVKPSLSLAFGEFCCCQHMGSTSRKWRETKNNPEVISRYALRTASVQTRTIELMSVTQALLICLGVIGRAKKAGIWTCLLWWVKLGWAAGAHRAALSLPLLSRKRGKVRWKNSWVEIMTGRLLTDYHHGQNS